MVNERKYATVAHDLRYLLTHPSAAEQLLAGGPAGGALGEGGRGAAAGEYFGWWLALCGWMQHMCPLMREGRDDVRPDDDEASTAAGVIWMGAFSLDINLTGVLPLLIKPVEAVPAAAAAIAGASSAPSDPTKPPGLLSLLRSCIAASSQALGGWLSGVAKCYPNNEVLFLPEWKAERSHAQMVSFHLPLHRTLAALLAAGLQRGETLSSLLPTIIEADALAWAEHPLRLQLLPLQLRLRWWATTGRVPWASDKFYRSRLHREIGWSRDMVLLQACASVLPPSAFLKTVLARAGLLDDGAAAADDAAAAPAAAPAAAAASAAADVSSPRAPPPPSAPLLPLRSSTSAAELEEVLQLLCQLFKGWAAAEATSLRCALVHQLALGPIAHSTIIRRLEPRWADHVDLEAKLLELGERDGGKYVLKPALWAEVDVTHPFYSGEEARQVAKRRHDLRAAATAAAAGGARRDGGGALLPTRALFSAALAVDPRAHRARPARRRRCRGRRRRRARRRTPGPRAPPAHCRCPERHHHRRRDGRARRRRRRRRGGLSRRVAAQAPEGTRLAHF